MASETTSSKDNIPDSARLIPKESSDKNDHILTITDDMAIDKEAKKYTVSNETKNSVACKILMLDGTDFKISVPSNAIGQVLFTLACEHLNLLEKEYFACSFKESNDVKVWLQNDKPIAKQLKKLKWEFSFEVKFYPQDPCVLREEITRYQLYLQLRVDILAGRLPCSFVSNSLLGSYACQSQLGDWDPSEHGQNCEYIKNIKFCPGQTEELIEKIAELHRTNQGMMADEAEFNYLENAKHMALYGVHQINAKDQDNGNVMIGICASGLLLYKDKIRLNRYIWPKIMKIAYKRNNFMVHLRGSPPAKTETVQTFKLANYKMAKRTWKLAVEHHAFFRLREPDEAPRGVFMRRGQKYFSGVTQFQADKAAEMIKRESQNFSRVYYTMGRGDIGGAKFDPGFNTLTVERKEETMEVDNTMRTLERKRNKPSVPMGDGMDGQENMVPYYDAQGNLIGVQKVTHSVSSTGEVFMNTGRRQSQDDLRGEYNGKEGHHVTMNVGPVDSYGMTYSKTPYPSGPGYLTPGGGPGLNTPLYTNTGGSGGYNTFNYNSGSPSYGLNGGRFGSGGEVRSDDPYAVGQEDHLKQQHGMYEQGGEWKPYNSTNTSKTLTRTYTAADGTVITETRTEKNGVVETHIEKRKNTADMDDDYDRMLADAIRSVTDMNPDLSVEKIEITKSD